MSRPSAACPRAAQVLAGVYHPDRLRVLNPCVHVRGRVTLVRQEPDGDLHLDLAVDPPYRYLLAPANTAKQHGDLVVELMARDAGHLPRSSVGDRLSLIGAWVDDAQHSWNELHPVWAVSDDGGPLHTSGPRYGGSPVGDRSFDAAAGCRTAAGLRCAGYGLGTGTGTDEQSFPTRRRSKPAGGSGAGASSARGCEPGYSPCLPRAGDLNCADIPADKKPVRVTGSDPYGLDRDHNGIGCQA